MARTLHPNLAAEPVTDPSTSMFNGSETAIQVKTRQQLQGEITRRLALERERLERDAGLYRESTSHFRKPIERPFTAAERDDVTILIGGLTWKHEHLLRAVFRAAGYRVDSLPVPDVEAFQLGKELGNNGQCNPAYFTVGNLIQYLKRLEAGGLSRRNIVDKYVYFTAGCCGPCRFGMYESEYRLGLQNAGFDGFRVMLFQQEDGLSASGEGGLRFTVAFGMGALSALNFGDVMNALAFQIRPYEVHPGDTDRAFTDGMARLAASIQDRDEFDIETRWPDWLARRVSRRKGVRSACMVLGKVWDHLYGAQTRDALRACRDQLNAVEVDRLRVRPKVKVTGEFWAQTTEGDGNFQMFRFLEQEGAEVMVEPIGNWVEYLLWQGRVRAAGRKGLDTVRPRWWELHRSARNELGFRAKDWGFRFGERFYAHQYRRVVDGLGGIAHPLLDMEELATLAAPFIDPLSRGGEGHLEVAKSIHYTVHKKAHMVLSLKPFGCMPSTQSDGVQSAVMGHFRDMIFLPIETSGEGAINAHSRVQMSFGEAMGRAKHEFQEALASTGKRLDDVRQYVSEHPALRQPLYRVPYRIGVTGTAATFLLHVSELMDGKTALRAVDGAS